MAEALGVARQRVYEIVEPEDFPAPIVRLKAGPVWQRSVLARFMGTGRPRGALAGAGGGEVLGYQPPKVSSMKNWMGSRGGLPIRSDPPSRW